MGRSDSEACPCQRHSCAWLDGSQGRAGLLSSMDAKGQCRALFLSLDLVSKIEIPAFLGAP